MPGIEYVTTAASNGRDLSDGYQIIIIGILLELVQAEEP